MAKRIDIPEEDWLKGLERIEEKLQEKVAEMPHASSIGLTLGLTEILGIAVDRAPVDTGDLRGSGFVDLDGKLYAKGTKGGSVSVIGSIPEEGVSVAQIGFDSKYAAEQHEHTEYDHPRGGQAKYLESALVENQDNLLKMIASSLSSSLFGGDDDA